MRKILVAVAFALATTLAIGASYKEPLSAQESAGKPNIVYIVTDDMRLDDMKHMPKTNSLLAKEGTTFSNAFVSYSTCCPSRASMLRGQYASNHQVLVNDAPKGGFQRFEKRGLQRSTVATWLDDGGYETGLFGKYLNDYPGKTKPSRVPPGWDEWFARLGPRDQYSYFGYKMNRNGKSVGYGTRKSDYSTDVLAKKSRNYIKGAARGNRPFFAYIAPTAPHGPLTPAKRHSKEFSGKEAPRPPSFNERDMSDKPEQMRKPRLSRKDVKQIDSAYRKRLRTLQAVDEMVEDVVKSLRAKGELDNTYIFFTSDNGFHLGEHRLALSKRTPYEETIRVPLVVRGPGVPAGQTRDEMALNTDFAPTFADLAGTGAPRFVDGRSLKPLLTGPPPENWRTGFLIENYYLKGRRTFGVRTDEYKYIEYSTGEKELYDLSSDPFELDSIHKTADPALLRDLKSRLQALKNCEGDSCRAAEDRR